MEIDVNTATTAQIMEWFKEQDVCFRGIVYNDIEDDSPVRATDEQITSYVKLLYKDRTLTTK